MKTASTGIKDALKIINVNEINFLSFTSFDELIYICIICNKCFTRKVGLDKHNREQHK